MPQQASIGCNGTTQACWCLFCFLFPENIMLKDVKKDSRVKNITNKNWNWTKRMRKCALCTFVYNTIDITLPSPIYPNTLQMLWAFCSITGGQRDFIWFPKLDKKQPFLNNTPEFVWVGSLTCRIQYNFSFIERIPKLSSHPCRRGNSLWTYCCSQAFWTQSPHL